MIDWKNKPDGAQRYNSNLKKQWLKRDGDNVSYYVGNNQWFTYHYGADVEKTWKDATPEPIVGPVPVAGKINLNTTPEPIVAPVPRLQLTWGVAKPEVTHILQNHHSSAQEFAVVNGNGELVKFNDRDELYDMRVWFTVSKRPVEDVKVYYVAGPMTGYDQFNRPAFNAESQRLSDEGHTVLNPATLPVGLTQAHYMDICLAMLRCATHIKMLGSWEKSEGARIEHALAIKSNITVEYST